ncbi:unnamed protein product, partial [Polarella glacialis]
ESLAPSEDPGGTQGAVGSQDPRRIVRSLSPPRRWKRPQPFLNLDKVQPSPSAQPSSAPSESERRLEPLVHLNEPLARARFSGASLARSGANPNEASHRPIASYESAKESSDVPHRPFTPPVVPIGKLLRGVYDAKPRIVALGGALAPQKGRQAPGVAEEAQERRLGIARGAELPVEEEVEEDVDEDESMMEAIYDPMLGIYYDPNSNMYYEKRQSGDGEHRAIGI